MQVSNEGGGGVRYLDVRRLVDEVRRRWWLILAITGACVGVALAAYATADPVYRANARLAIDRRTEVLVKTEGAPPELTADSAAVDTEVQKLRSPDLAETAVNRLRLFADPTFVENVADPAAAKRAATSALMSNFVVQREGTSFAIGVSYRDGDPVRATRIVNTMIDIYRSGGVGQREAERQRQVKLLEERLVRLRADLTAAEDAVARYKIANGIIDVAKDNTLQQSAITALNNQLAQAQAQQAEAQSRLAAAQGQLSRGRGGEALGDTLSSAVISDLRRQQAQLSVEAADLGKRYGPRHPDLIRVREQQEAIEGRIQAEVGRIVASLSTEAQASAGRTASIRNSISGAEGTVAQQQAASAHLSELERNAESARGLYQMFLDRYSAVVAQAGTDPGSARVIATAQVPGSPESPQLLAYLLIGLLSGGLLSILALLLFRLQAKGVETSADVERALGLPLLGSSPDLRTVPGLNLAGRTDISPSQFVIDDRGSFYAEAIRNIRAAIPPAATNGKVIAITSALPSEGKTSLAISLARSAGLAGQKVLLIDTDLRRRASTRSLADDVQVGLVEVLEGKAKLAEAIVRDSQSGAFLLPQAVAETDKYDAISTDRMQGLLAQLRTDFDLVVLDCAPALAVAESCMVASAADAVLFVIRWRETPVQSARAALDRLARFDANIAGAVVTLVDTKRQARLSEADAGAYRAYRQYYA